jgi:aspartyl-tRNA(Asn)/glutamyl-tRNA(Gln) amidotransferase subunit C
MEIEDIKKLANMARIDMDEAEMAEIAKSFGPILSYVGQVQEVSDGGGDELAHDLIENHRLHNVTREDIATNKTGEYTDRIMENAPDTENGYIKVKQIL